MISLFTVPKPFTDPHIAMIQRNAIMSWLARTTISEIILLGDDMGVAEVAEEFQLRHLPELATNEFGTPLVNDIFERGCTAARHELKCFINADIILQDDFDRLIELLPADRLFCVGRRVDVDIKATYDLRRSAEAETVATLANEAGALHGPYAMDYFIFNTIPWDEMSPFALGRPGYDNWMIFMARREGCLVDVTSSVQVIHQNHWRHREDETAEAYDDAQVELRRNNALCGSVPIGYTCQLIAGNVLKDGKLNRTPLFPNGIAWLKVWLHWKLSVLKHALKS